MQQDSATLIYDLNTMKGTMDSYIKKKIACTAIQNCTAPKPEKSHLILEVSKKQKTILNHLNDPGPTVTPLFLLMDHFLYRSFSTF